MEISLPGLLNEIIENDPDAAVDPNWILSLNTNVTEWLTEGPAETWARLLKRQSSLHRIKNIAHNAISKSSVANPDDLIQEITDELTQVSLDRIIDDSSDRQKSIDNYLDYVHDRLQKKDNIVPSMYPNINKKTLGFAPGKMITIGARTSVGKSVFAGNCAVAAAAAQKSVLMFSLEMTKNEVMDRLVSSISMINLREIMTTKLEGEKKENFDNAIETLRNYKLDIDDSSNVTVDYIRSKALKKAQSDDGLDFIIIDYLQLISTPNKHSHSRQEEVAEISRQIKILSGQLQVPVMVLVQLKRGDGDESEDALPQLKDIRESGAIAQDSDIVILIHRKLDDESVDPKALFLIAKNRGGELGKIVVRAKMQYATFQDDTKPKTIEGQEEPEQVSELSDIPDDDDSLFSDDPSANVDFQEGDF